MEYDYLKSFKLTIKNSTKFKMEKKLTSQEEIWRTDFGENYNKRNTYTNDELDKVYKEAMGISRTEMVQKFFGDLDKDTKILEVGCNIGLMLVNLQELGFKNLYGIEIQPSAIEQANQRTTGLKITEGSAYDLPYKDEEFDLVFSTHVLIHLDPKMIHNALSEIVRCSKNLIFGNEYFAEELTEINNYYGQANMVWKRDFAKLYTDLFPNVKLVKEENIKYLSSDDIESVFLLKKQK